MAIGNNESKTTPPNNSKIKNELTNSPDIKDNKNYVPIQAENPYHFLTNAYTGRGGFRDGSYLINHAREMFYDKRRDCSFYVNYLRPILGKMVEPVFNKNIKREITPDNNTLLVSTFIKNVDNLGNDINSFMEIVMRWNWLHGLVFVVVDNFKEIPDTNEQAINERIMPYAYIRYAWEYYSHEVDNYGSIRSIEFEGKEKTVKTSRGEKRYRVIEHWDYFQFYRYDIDKDTKEESPPYDIFDHNLGILPVVYIPTGLRENHTDILVDSPLYDIARLNHMLFNRDSEMRESERTQGFSQFCIQTDSLSDMQLGKYSIIGFGTDVTIPPFYASPDPNVIKELRENISIYTEIIFRVAEQDGFVQGVKQAQSGIAMQWDFEPQNKTLSKTSLIASEIEDKIIQIFKAYTNQDFEYNANYPTDFKPGADREVIQIVTELIDLGVSGKAKAYAIKEAYKRGPFNKEDEGFEDAIKSIEQSIEEENQRINLMPNNNNEEQED